MLIIYSIGIVLLIMFVKSMILNPILFKKKWQAVLGYGVPGIVCLLVFFGSIFLEYNAEQAYFKDQNERIATSDWEPPRVSGNVISVKATTANSNYVSIPVTNNSNLQKGLDDLQIDLDKLQNNVDSGNENSVTAINNGKPAIIGDTDSKIYHLPGDPYYNKEMKKLDNNLYFRTEQEAEEAGFRPIKT